MVLAKFIAEDPRALVIESRVDIRLAGVSLASESITHSMRIYFQSTVQSRSVMFQSLLSTRALFAVAKSGECQV